MVEAVADLATQQRLLRVPAASRVPPQCHIRTGGTGYRLPYEAFHLKRPKSTVLEISSLPHWAEHWVA